LYTVKMLVNEKETVTFDTSNRALARAAYLVGQAVPKSIVVTIVRKVEPQQVKFR